MRLIGCGSRTPHIVRVSVVFMSHRIAHSTLMLGRSTYFVLISCVCFFSVVVLKSAACYRNACLHKTGFPPPVYHGTTLSIFY
jgi:hypothetical protein